MIATLWQWKWWLTNVGPNEVASLLWATPTLLALGWKVRKEWRAHRSRLFAHHQAVHDRLTAIEDHIGVHDVDEPD